MRQEEQENKPYKNDYLIYARKSTDDSINQKNTIEYQTQENLKFAERESLSIAKLTIEGFCTNGIIIENHSAFKEGKDFKINDDGDIIINIQRPKFAKLIKFLATGEIKGVISLCQDRISRNSSDSNLLRKLRDKGVDVRFVQVSYEKTSAGELHMDMDETFAQHNSRVTREKVKNTTAKLRAEGICTYRAPVGYLNEGDMKNKPFDPIRAPIVKEMFEKYAEGNWSLTDLAKWGNEQGLTMQPMRRRRTPEEKLSDTEIKIDPVSRMVDYNQIQKILRNPFYIGLTLGNDKVHVRSVSHKPLVDEELFYRVQSMLKSKKVSVHYSKAIPLPYRKLVYCDYCHRVYTPYKKKDVYFYGARCRRDCPNTSRNVNSSFIEERIGNVLASLYFTDEELIEIDTRVRNEIGTLDNNKDKQISKIENKKRKLREELAYLHQNKLSLLKTKTYSPEEYIAEEDKIYKGLEKFRLEEEALDVSMQEIIKDVVLLSEILKDAYVVYSLANPREKEEIIKKVFSEITISEKTLKYKTRNGFKALENKKTLLGDPTENRTLIPSLRRMCPNR